MYDNLADLYSIMVALDHLETAYVRDSITADAYTKACNKLIAQFKTLQETVSDVVPDLEKFMKDYHMTTKAAFVRLKVGVPATVVHGGSGEEKKELAVFHVVQHFITAMDSLKLNMRAVDELHPHISELMESINKVNGLPPEHEAKIKVRTWLVKFSSMKAHDELSEEDARQMSFDLDGAYNAFHRFIQQGNKK